MRHLLWLWWTQGPAQANDRAVIPPKVDLVIFSNAPKIGWEAHLLEFSNRRSLERARSPRPYKLLGAGSSISASQSFCHLIKGNYVQFGLDNRTAVAYINRLGGTRSHHLNNNKKRSHTQLDSRKQVIAFQDRVITIKR